ncbi:hypothetical protein ABPS01_00890 [Streptococcus sp. ZJ151]|uniref:hypothetical protein n=1 Tax=Streptococcus jiangjianxini TaxID=3161189 RepID=UPI0032F06A95
MIEELNLSPFWLAIVVLITLWLMYQITKIPSKIDTENTVEDSKNTGEAPEYLERYGAVIQMQGR